MINEKMIKILGMAATAMGIGATLITSWLDDQKMDKKINEKINEAITKINERES